MQKLTRISKVCSAALFGFIAIVCGAAPAFASAEGEKIDTLAEFSAAGEPLNVAAILTVGAVLLVLVLGSATLVGSLFNKK